MTTQPPPQTQGGDLTFDPRLGVLVLTDARTCDQYETATWTLAGTTWSEAVAPLAIGRSGYDAVHGEVVTFERYNDDEHGPWAWTADGWKASSPGITCLTL